MIIPDDQKEIFLFTCKCGYQSFVITLTDLTYEGYVHGIKHEKFTLEDIKVDRFVRA